MARRRPDLRLLTTTETVRDTLASCGFRNVRHVPYPTPVAAGVDGSDPSFRHLLFAGAARRDKGFQRVVDLVERLAEADERIPVLIQTVGDFYGRLSPEVQADIRRLHGLNYAALRTEPASLDESEYRRVFQGAVCLQLYHPVEFADRVSGVTLDALASGAPLLVHQGTWMARVVNRFGAGAAVEVDDIQAALEGLRRLVSDYRKYSEAARRGGVALAEEHDPLRLVEAVLG